MTARTPNILWIVTTQWRAQAWGGAGDPNARTPHLDRLAATAVNFTEAVTPHPFGPWARAALLTGVPSPENGVRDYFDPLPTGTRTIAHQLGERGYRTAFFGKWHLSRRDPQAPLVGEAHARTRVPPEARGGFDFWEGFESGFLLNDPWLHGSRLPEPTQIRGYQALKRQGALPVLMDEGILAPEVAAEFIALDMMDGIAMKPARNAGLRPSVQIVNQLLDRGLMVLGSGLTDPDFSLAGALQLFAWSGIARPCALNGPQFLAESLLGEAIKPCGDVLALPTAPGLGFTPDARAAERLRIVAHGAPA